MRNALCTARTNALMAEARAFLTLQATGAGSTFTVTYSVPADRNGDIPVTLIVAHEPSAGSSQSQGSWPEGIWMFKVEAGAPGTDLWVTRPNNTTECSIPAGYTGTASGWSCSHIAQDGGGNGWIMATAAYEPYTVFNAMSGLVSNATSSQISLSNSTVAGQPVECLSVRGQSTAEACASPRPGSWRRSRLHLKPAPPATISKTGPPSRSAPPFRRRCWRYQPGPGLGRDRLDSPPVRSSEVAASGRPSA